MSILVDSNILWRLARSDDPQHEVAKKAVELCLQRREELLITPQAQREFWVVATRPRDKNGLGMSPISANLFYRISPPALFVFEVILATPPQFGASLQSFLSAKVVVEWLV